MELTFIHAHPTASSCSAANPAALHINTSRCVNTTSTCSLCVVGFPPTTTYQLCVSFLPPRPHDIHTVFELTPYFDDSYFTPICLSTFSTAKKLLYSLFFFKQEGLISQFVQTFSSTRESVPRHPFTKTVTGIAECTSTCVQRCSLGWQDVLW